MNYYIHVLIQNEKILKSTIYNIFDFLKDMHSFLRWTTDEYKRKNNSPFIQEALRNSDFSRTTELIAKQLKIDRLYKTSKSFS